ncbi:hypothetical protein BACT_0071 [Bifidobacterium actinocoloniiforme DSM 22766]|uniref:Uncharacterized protein n=1 Tax=Bifidobacterium actinocoloniiforme DSM 22766 TaxID=1437605 RepID=A0A086YWG6_9BIFI|nr:hypothetical protein BACT_0071 [Bifidobacterium actinocoloniiforme DSM 22766]
MLTPSGMTIVVVMKGFAALHGLVSVAAGKK